MAGGRARAGRPISVGKTPACFMHAGVLSLLCEDASVCCLMDTFYEVGSGALFKLEQVTVKDLTWVFQLMISLAKT